MRHPLKVGDILKMSWGYDQTNIDFFKVTKLCGTTMVELVPIGSKVVREERGADYVVADPDHVLDPERTIFDRVLRKRPNGHGSCKIFKWGGWAYPWDDNPAYETAAGWGH